MNEYLVVKTKENPGNPFNIHPDGNNTPPLLTGQYPASAQALRSLSLRR
jgi:hypothetical protein